MATCRSGPACIIGVTGTPRPNLVPLPASPEMRSDAEVCPVPEAEMAAHAHGRSDGSRGYDPVVTGRRRRSGSPVRSSSSRAHR